MIRHKEKQLVPENIDQFNQASTVPLTTTMNHPLHNMMNPLIHQNLHDYNSHDLNKHVKMGFPPKDLIFNGAKCGTTYYDERDIIFARAEGCSRIPFYDDNTATIKAIKYHPANPGKYTEPSPFYLFPIGKPILRTMSARCKFIVFLLKSRHT